MSDDTVRYFLRQYAVEAKSDCPSIPDNVHPHLFRHSRAMHLYRRGMDLTLISQWLGHANLETSLIYAHADTEQKRQALKNPWEERLPAALKFRSIR
ncbi:tyrosine-type recombinase/integrase [Caproicibacter fermentans]|uniref:tyrosine-type recombinase/integrase n=1 Tax=Caproicibacter fermentans TaxID=2576756 RepID=UPI0012EDF719